MQTIYNKVNNTFLLLFILVFFIQCEKDYIPNENLYHYHRENYQPINCYNEITDWSELFQDSLITIPELIQIPQVDSSYIDWTNNKFNRIDIRSLTSSNFSDLQCFKNYIGNRSIVQLGESSHGSREYSQIKVRLIKFLHEEMGFNVIAFESGFFECYYTNDNIQQFPVYPAMQNSIFWIWGTPELRDLFLYIKNTHSTNNPLNLAGFDCQFSSRNNSIILHPTFLYDVLSEIDSIQAYIYKGFDSVVIQNMLCWNQTYLSQYKDSINYTFYEIVNYIDNNVNELMLLFSENPEIPFVLKQSVLNLIAYMDFIISYNSLYINPVSVRIRDSTMASNVIFIKEKLYPQKKLIIWAHNYHIANSSYLHAVSPDIKVMGNWLHEKYTYDLYTIGAYMLRGKTKYNESFIDVQLPVSPNSVEAILYYTKKKYCFIDLANQNYCSSNRWMFNLITAKYEGFASESMIIRNVYDGLIFIDSSSVPVYLP